jgi:hypothetical protein
LKKPYIDLYFYCIDPYSIKKESQTAVLPLKIAYSVILFYRQHSNQPDDQVLSPLQNNFDEIEESPFSDPLPHSSSLRSSLQSSSTKFTTNKVLTTRTTTIVPTSTIKKEVFKPTFFHSGTYRHTGLF